MSHDNHKIDNLNKDIDDLILYGVTNREEAKEYYLNLAKDLQFLISKLGLIIVYYQMKSVIYIMGCSNQ